MFEKNLRSAEKSVGQANSNKQTIISTPTMLAPEEQKLLYLLAKDYYTGEGSIFDAGICLGGCTESFARGLAARDSVPPLAPIVHAYELGIADEDYVTEFIRNQYGEERHKGDSFVDIIQKNIDSMPCREAIRFFPGDILEQPYPASIEIMFLDVCKTQAINFKMQQLFARLIPGKSIVIQQDYIHAWSPYIHTTMGYLAEYFEPVGPVECSSFVFLLKKKIPLEILNNDVFGSAPVEKLEEYLTHYYSYFLGELHRNTLEMARAMLLFEKGEKKRCFDLISELSQKEKLPWNFVYTSEYLGAGPLVRCNLNRKSPVFPMKHPNLSERRLQEIRKFTGEMDSGSQSNTAYQDSVLFFLRTNAFRGENIVEVGCYKGGLTAQYAYLCKELGKRLHVVDIDEQLLNHTRELVAELGYADVATFHLMDYEKFTQSEFFPHATIATIIDADHSYEGCLRDCLTLKKVIHSMYGVIFHDFSLRYHTWDGVGVDRAIYEVFGQDVRLYPIGFQSVCPGSLTPEVGAYFESNEGVVMVVPWQPMEEIFVRRCFLTRVKHIVKNSPLGPLAIKVWRVWQSMEIFVRRCSLTRVKHIVKNSPLGPLAIKVWRVMKG
jgi:predicted O-methyltransferase YrrM